MLYHYTDRETIESIRRDGVIRARPQTLYEEFAGPFTGDGKTLTTIPLVWLTINPILDGTILSKLVANDREPTDLCRIVLPVGYGGDVGLAEFTEAANIPHIWWQWAIKTGAMVGSHYTTWRIVTWDVPATDWLGVESMVEITADGPRWEALP